MKSKYWISSLAASVWIAALGCGDDGGPRESYAVGTLIGPTALSTTRCTYEADPNTATISRDEDGNAFMAKLVAPGTVTKTCNGRKTVIDVLQPTSLEIHGPSTLKVGADNVEVYRVIPRAKDRALLGMGPGSQAPTWELDGDCQGVAAFAPVLGSQDTGGRDVTRKLEPHNPGKCTLKATALGLTAEKSVVIR